MATKTVAIIFRGFGRLKTAMIDGTLRSAGRKRDGDPLISNVYLGICE
jgi:hypothetical protein